LKRTPREKKKKKRKEKKKKSTFFLKKKRMNKTRRHKAKTPTPTPIPIPITWLLSSFSAGLQIIPSPKYPSLHSHSKPPSIFLQFACSLHPPRLFKHSSISNFHFIILFCYLFWVKKKKINTWTIKTISWIFWFTCTWKASWIICANSLIVTSSITCWTFINIYYN